MSQPSEVVSTAVQIDWKLIAAAGATFIATFIISILGWYQGRKRIERRIDGTVDGQVTGAILLDNQTIREATVVQRELRDRLLVHTEAVHSNCKAVVDNTSSMDEILQELRSLRRSIDKLLTKR